LFCFLSLRERIKVRDSRFSAVNQGSLIPAFSLREKE
jgi:hypothetical protein